MSPNNPLLRTSCDKVHAPHHGLSVGVSVFALRRWRLAAERGRWAPL